MFNKGSTGQMSLNLSMKITVLLAISMLTSFSSLADVDVVKPYVRATIPGTTVSSAYMELHNQSDKSVKLIAATSPVSDRVEIHEHSMANGMMKMRQVESLSVDANSKAILQPSGYHIMIFNLKEPLKVGDDIELTLIFDNDSKEVVKVPVQSIKRKKKNAHHHHH